MSELKNYVAGEWVKIKFTDAAVAEGYETRVGAVATAVIGSDTHSMTPFGVSESFNNEQDGRMHYLWGFHDQAAFYVYDDTTGIEVVRAEKQKLRGMIRRTFGL